MTAPGVDVVDLSLGRPDPAVLPLAGLHRAAAEALAGPDRSGLQYGPTEGGPALRDGVAGLLSRHYGRPVSAAELFITAGATHGLDLILSHLASPGDTVFVEDPTYLFVLDVLRSRGMRVVPVATDQDGLDVAALECRLRDDVPALVYTIPVYHNPTGATLAEERRRRLAELAHEYGFLVVADEVYQLVGAPERRPAPMRTVDGERVLSLGSFSKILGPGLRLGWVEAAPGHFGRLADDAVLRSGGGVSPFANAVVAAAIELGVQDECLAGIQAVYERRRRHSLSVLPRLLPAGVRMRHPDGGFYLWLELPGGVDAGELASAAEATGVRFCPGSVFSCAGNFRNCLRLCFIRHTEERLTVAYERLGRLLHAHVPDTVGIGG